MPNFGALSYVGKATIGAINLPAPESIMGVSGRGAWCGWGLFEWPCGLCESDKNPYETLNPAPESIVGVSGSGACCGKKGLCEGEGKVKGKGEVG